MHMIFVVELHSIETRLVQLMEMAAAAAAADAHDSCFVLMMHRIWTRPLSELQLIRATDAQDLETTRAIAAAESCC